uniref:Arrestin domain-containing protein 3-like n=1 Tax=Hirondellea gigas TaxID=1518452 RepID=A0A6A7GAG3_9CRUS
MAPPASVTIVFLQQTAVYFPGQTVVGRVEVTNAKPVKCEGISMKFECSARVNFSVVEDFSTTKGKSKTERRFYQGQEESYKSKYFLWSDPSQELAAGSHQYPFSFVIPHSCPGSFQCKFGYVLHYCQASIIRVGMSKKIFSKRPYCVNSLLDLNMNPANKVSQQMQGMKTLCCLCCRSGPISATIRVDRTGYVPGEAIVICGEINNASNRKVNYTKVELFMMVTLTGKDFRGISRNKEESCKLMEFSKPEIPEGGDCFWEGHHLIIPPLPASGLIGCNIINIVYNLKFTVQPKIPATPLILTFPITIGSIPLHETFGNFVGGPMPYPSPSPAVGFSEKAGLDTSGEQPPHPSAPMALEDPPAYSVPYIPAFESYPDLPPPSYYRATSEDLQCVPSAPAMGDSSDDDADEQTDFMKTFAPTYVSYNLKK